MAPDRGRGGAEYSTSNLADDFDAEYQDDSDASNATSDSEVEDDVAREHYVDVGRSELRRPKPAVLGPQYRGAKISRHAVSDDEDEDDPFLRDFGDDESDEEESRKRDLNSTANAYEDHDSEGEESMESGSDMSDRNSGIAKIPAKLASNGMTPRDDRYEILKKLAKDQSEVASRLAQSHKEDAKKGLAVKQQRAGFDQLLGVRIKLQKAMIGANSIVGTGADDVQSVQDKSGDAIERAETAALNLWSSLNNLRESLIDARAGQKRKRTSFPVDTPTSDLWSQIQQQEESSLPYRNATLQRWSVKARSATVQPQHTLLSKSERGQPTIIDALQSYLSKPDRLLKKAHTPRSCAPLQLAANVSEDEDIYDDADFYSLLLTSLLEQKSSESSSLPSVVDLNMDWKRDAKTKKHVDTKASKGRKLRYTVHEKLQNFMAPEDRRRWGDRQCEDLFGSLFGRSVALDDGVDEARDGTGQFDEEAFMLFRS